MHNFPYKKEKQKIPGKCMDTESEKSVKKRKKNNSKVCNMMFISFKDE